VKEIVEMIIAATDLVEAEGRSLRYHFFRLACAIVMALIAAAVCLSGLGWLVWSAFTALSAVMPHPAAAAIVGVALLGISGALTWMSRKMIF
jgi:hypothetical protein